MEGTGFNIDLTGFSVPEIELIIGENVSIGSKESELDNVPSDPPASAVVTKHGDCWVLGNKHRLICSDATRPEPYEILLAGKRAHMIFTDPPYNVRINGHVSGKGRHKHAEFRMASGEMTELQFMDFLKAPLGHAARHSIDGSLHFICMDWAHLFELLSVCRLIYSDLKNICVWNKTNAGMGSLYRSKHEFVVVAKHGRKPHINNIELGIHGRYRTNVWDYAGVNTFKAERQSELESHPTVKPVAMVADAIRDCSRHKHIILDPFMGSGTTLIAAEITGRAAYGIELEPKYVDVAIRRWIDLTGGEVRHAQTGALYPSRQAISMERAHG